MTERVHILLLRHGETEGGARYRGATDDRLTATGWRQMQAAVATETGWTQLVSSPLARCTEFARALAQERSVRLRVDPRWREIDFGDWEGLTAEEIARRWPQDYARFLSNPWAHGPPAGESMHDFEQRVLAAWRELLAECRPTLLVSHGGPLRIVLCHALGLPRAEFLRLQIPHGAIYRLTVPAERARRRATAP